MFMRSTDTGVGLQVPGDDVCKMEAEGNVCDLHVAGAAIVGS